MRCLGCGLEQPMELKQSPGPGGEPHGTKTLLERFPESWHGVRLPCHAQLKWCAGDD